MSNLKLLEWVKRLALLEQVATDPTRVCEIRLEARSLDIFPPPLADVWALVLNAW